MNNAIDCATKLNAVTASNLVKNGVSAVGRYLSHNWKGIDKAEADAIKSAGLNIFSIFEKGATKPSYFTIAQGKADALEAVGYAKEIGQPEGTAIYFTVDYDAQPKDFPSILAYFRAVRDNLQGYAVGAYGSFSVLKALYPTGFAKYYFQTAAWSGGQHNKFLHIYQYQCDKTFAGLNVDLDNLEQTEVGAWGNVVQAKEEEEMLDKAIVINGFADFATAEPLANRLQAPIYTRSALNGRKVSHELYVVGGTQDGLQADKVILLSGKDRYEVAAAVKKFLG